MNGIAPVQEGNKPVSIDYYWTVFSLVRFNIIYEMNKKLVLLVLFLFIIGLIGDQLTTRIYYRRVEDVEEPESREPEVNPELPLIKPPSLFYQNPLRLPRVKSNTWMVYDAVIACLASIVTFALNSKSDDNDSIKIVTLVFIFLILVSATLKLMNTFTHLMSIY